MVRIVLTGGPCGGKSTVLEYLKVYFKDQVVFVNEVATALLADGFPLPNPWSQEWQDLFQEGIIIGQFNAENEAIYEATKKGIRVIVCDRGVLDGAAYVKGGVAEFCKRFNLDKEKELSQYDAVIHLESLATLNPDMYVELMTTNPSRFESVPMAEEREMNLRQAWAGHKERHHIASTIISQNIDKVVQIIEQYILKGDV